MSTGGMPTGDGGTLVLKAGCTAGCLAGGRDTGAVCRETSAGVGGIIAEVITGTGWVPAPWSERRGGSTVREPGADCASSER